MALQQELAHIVKETRSIVRKRMKEFESVRKFGKERIFSEMCFCILTANFNAERSISIQNKIGEGFLTMSKKDLAKKLKELGHRFPNTRAEYITLVREKINEILEQVRSGKTEFEIREWLVRNIKGLGYKEASHFLRNIGFKNVAILDFHILDLLEKYGIIKKPRTLTRRKYLEIEENLRNIAKELNISPAELDLYLWYMETGKVLK